MWSGKLLAVGHLRRVLIIPISQHVTVCHLATGQVTDRVINIQMKQIVIIKLDASGILVRSVQQFLAIILAIRHHLATGRLIMAIVQILTIISITAIMQEVGAIVIFLLIPAQVIMMKQIAIIAPLATGHLQCMTVQTSITNTIAIMLAVELISSIVAGTAQHAMAHSIQAAEEPAMEITHIAQGQPIQAAQAA